MAALQILLLASTSKTVGNYLARYTKVQKVTVGWSVQRSVLLSLPFIFLLTPKFTYFAFILRGRIVLGKERRWS